MENKLKVGQRIDIYKSLIHYIGCEKGSCYPEISKDWVGGIRVGCWNTKDESVHDPYLCNYECRKIGTMVVKELKTPKHETTE